MSFVLDPNMTGEKQLNNPLAQEAEKAEMDAAFNAYIKTPQIERQLGQWLSNPATKDFKPPIFYDREKKVWWWASRSQRKKLGLI